MHIFENLLSGDIFWRIHRNDPGEQELSFLPGCFFINPLLYSKLTLRRIHAMPLGLTEDDVIVTTNGIVLGTSRDAIQNSSIPFEHEATKNPSLGGPSDSEISAILTYAEKLAVNLRQASGQVDIPRSVAMISRAERSQLPTLDFPQKVANSESFIHKYNWDSAVSWSHLLIADAEIADRKTPIHEKLVLDAIHALRGRDYRRSLLYAAITIESLAAAKLDEAYTDAIQGRRSSNNLRIILRPKAGGVTVSTDPVCEFLLEKSKFAERLHEVPLYLLDRSLLVENELLYQNALKLYRTRNKIAHLGEPPSGEQSYFEMSEDDSMAAIECAIDIIRWFGERADFPLPKYGWVKLNSPRESERP